MKLLSLVSCFPTFLETDKENYFETVQLERIGFGNQVQNCEKKIHNSLVSGLGTRKQKVSSSLEKSREKNVEDFWKTSQSQYNYLSSNLVETNAHVLGLYKKVKDFETNCFLKMRNEIEMLSHKVEEGSCLSAPESEQLNTQTDIIYLYHKLDKISDTVKYLESRLQSLKEERDSEQRDTVFQVLSGSDNPGPSDYDLAMTPTDQCQPSRTLHANLLRFLLPSVVTMTAILVNMFVYVSSSRKFPY